MKPNHLFLLLCKKLLLLHLLVIVITFILLPSLFSPPSLSFFPLFFSLLPFFFHFNYLKGSTDEKAFATKPFTFKVDTVNLKPEDLKFDIKDTLNKRPFKGNSLILFSLVILFHSFII